MRIAALLLGVALSLGAKIGQDVPKSDIFVGDDPIPLTLSAPFADLLAHAESDPDYEVKGRLTWSDDAGTFTIDDVRVSERGHTSRRSSECAFPKLKLDFDKAKASRTPLAGHRTLKLGTHCDDRPDDQLTRRFGRLANERAPLREAMVYRMLEAAGVPTLRSRPARVTYVDTQRSAESLTRFALLLEDDDEAAERVGASGTYSEDDFGAARDLFDERDTARLAFAEALIGNFDWCLRMFAGDIYRCDDRHPLWNVLAFRRQDQRALPLLYDLDLAGPVVGRHIWFDQVFSADFVQPPSHARVEVQAQVQRTRSLFERTVLDSTRRHFVEVRPAMLEAIERSAADERGKAVAREYLEAFYDAIESDASFYRPVVIESGHHPWQDAEARQPACQIDAAIPVGTPVSEPLEISGERVRVRILDALWEWTGPRRCDEVHRQPVWIASDAIGTDYPR